MFFGVAGRAGTPDKRAFLYQRKGPWPQPSPLEPLGHAAEVLHLPQAEWDEFDREIGSRYKWTLLRRSPGAALDAWRERIVRAVPDEDFDRWLSDGVYSKFLFEGLDPIDEEHFAPAIAAIASRGETEPKWFKIDLTPMGKVQAYPGMYVASTCTLLRQDAPDAPLRAVAISVEDGAVVVTPSEANAWELAKYFVLQGLAYGTLFTQHPNVHFPFDTVNAVTKGALPTTHVLFKLLIPHLQFSLALDNAVLESKTTVISNDPHTIYDPFCARASDGLMDFFVAGYRGIPGNRAYEPYRYVLSPRKTPSRYGAFLEAYWAPVRDFVEGVLAYVHPGDPAVSEWAHWIAQWVPGFPDEHAIWEGTNLVDAVTSVIWNVAIVHSADHEDFARSVPVDLKCFRLRRPPPASTDEPPVDRAALMHWVDVFQSKLAHEMFFAPSNVTRLVDVRYGFDVPDQRRLANRFQQRLRATEAELRRKGIPIFMPLEKMAASIQY